METQTFYCYLITNHVNGKQYVGQTSKTIEKRYKGHISAARKGGENKHLYNSIRKYGIENFSVKEIGRANSHEAILGMEIIKIQEYDTFKNGYNLTLGGEGNVGYECSDETRMKMSVSRKCRICSDETREKMSASMKGFVHTQKTIDQISQTKQNRTDKQKASTSAKLSYAISQLHKNYTPEQKTINAAKISKGHQNQTIEQKSKISKILSLSQLNYTPIQRQQMEVKRHQTIQNRTPERQIEITKKMSQAQQKPIFFFGKCFRDRREAAKYLKHCVDWVSSQREKNPNDIYWLEKGKEYNWEVVL